MSKRLHSLLAVIFLGLIAASVGAAAQSKAAQPQIKFEKYTLKNGMDVILHEDHRLPLVTVNFWYHVGPANERPGRTGFAHLFEHMMFEGSQHVGPKAIFKYLEGAGASDINGSTDFDRTNYFETLPSNQLELALWLERKHTKAEILELYLNRVYFGSGAYGVEAAAQRYFGKSAKSVTIAEAAMLAGLVKSPSRLAPNRNPEGAAQRAQLVLTAMADAKFITDAQAQASIGHPS